MLTITPCTDKQTMARYCQKCRKPVSEALYLYLAENRGEVLAAGLFEVAADSVSPVFFEAADPSDVYLFDGVLRAGLNYAAEQGLENGFIAEGFRLEHRALFAKLNYPIHLTFNITNFFRKYKNCAGR